MDPIIWTYTVYILLAVPVTVWVARTLHKNGKVFLVDCFNGNRELAESVNHLLVVGFYLVNIGFIALYLKVGTSIVDARGVFEGVAAKIGIVLLVLGAVPTPVLSGHRGIIELRGGREATMSSICGKERKRLFMPGANLATNGTSTCVIV